MDLQIYSKDTSKITKLNPSTVLSSFGFMSQENMSGNVNSMSMMGSRINVFNELSNNVTLIKNTYDILAGRLPKSKEEVILIVDSFGEISDYALYAIGLKDQQELTDMTSKIMKGEELEEPTQTSYTYDEILGTEFKLVLNTDYYKKKEIFGLINRQIIHI